MAMSLEERVARLESENAALAGSARRWRRGGAAGLGVLGVVLMAGLAQSGDTVKGSRVVVTDADGQERLVLAATKDGAGLRINGPDGKLRLAIGEGKIPGSGDGAAVWIFDTDEKPRVGLGVGDAGDLGLVLLDEQGQPMAPPTEKKQQRR